MQIIIIKQMASCRITPMVRRPDGKMTESKLHSDLSLFMKDKTMLDNVWDMAHKGDLESNDGSDFELDENGEPTVAEILGKTQAGDLVSDDDIVNGLNLLRQEEKPYEGTQGVKRAAMEAAVYNESSPLANRAVADVNVEENSGKIVFTAVTKESQSKAMELANGVSLSDKLESWLNSKGIAIGTLTEAEEGAGIQGVADFSATKRTADGLREMIRVARGETGKVAITEEAAHVAVMALNGKDEAVTRALNVLMKNNELIIRILGDEYESYKLKYGGDLRKLAHEAAGHLLRDQLNDTYKSMQDSEVSKFSMLWNKLKNGVLNFFRSFSTSELDAMLMEAREGLHETARNILDDSCYEELDFSEEADAIGQLFAIDDESQTKLEDMTLRLIHDLNSRAKLIPSFMRRYKEGKGKKNLALGRYRRLKALHSNIEHLREEHKELEAVYNYLDNASKDLQYQLRTFKKRYDSAKPENRPYIILNIYNLIDVYTQVHKDVMAVLEIVNEKSANEPEVIELLPKFMNIIQGYEENGQMIPGMSTLLEEATAKIQRFMMPTFLNFVSKYVSLDNVIVPNGGVVFGREAGTAISIEDQMVRSPEVGTIDKWFLPAALSNSLPVQVFQRVMNLTNLEVRDMMLEYKKRLQELALNLENAGYDNQDWMFKRDLGGKLMGTYIEIDSDEYRRLSKAQKDFYHGVLSIKRELDEMLPMEMRDLLNAPKIRKDFLEQLKRKDKASWKAVKDYMSEIWSFKSDNEYTLENDRLLIDYNNKQLRIVPIRFLRFAENEDNQNLSLDVVNTITIYAQMCCNYSKMTRVMPALELGRHILEEGFSEKKKVYRDEDGKQKRGYIVGEKRGLSNDDNTMSRINDIMESGYGFKVENITATIFGKNISLTAVGHALMSLTAANQYMMSVNAAVQNSITAQLQFLGGLGSRGKYYNKNDFTFAHSVFTKNIVQLMSDATKRVPDSKISLFCERFNIMMRDEHHPFNRKAGRVVDSKNLYFMTTMGEFHANTLISLAIAHRFKLKDANGIEMNLWDATEVVDMAEKKLREARKLRKEGSIVEADAIEDNVRKHPEWKNSNNKYLVLKEGVTKLDGTEVTEQDLHVVTRKMMHVSHILNGVYNVEDAAKWQRYLGGQLIGMYRKWIAPSVYRRLNKLNYTLDEEDFNEGFYRTALRIASTRVKALYDKNVAAQIKGNKLEEWEKKNLWQAGVEIGMWLSLIGLKILLSNYKSKRRSYLWNSMYYYVSRTTSELSSLNPLGMVGESMRILRSPSACLSTLNNLTGLVGCMVNPYTWGFTDSAYVDRGKYKGMTKLERSILKSPFLPGSHQLFAFMYPEDAVKFYE